MTIAWQYIPNKVLGEVFGYQTCNKYIDNLEDLLFRTFYTGKSGTLACNPPDGTGGTVTILGLDATNDEHNSRTLRIESGSGIGTAVSVDDTLATQTVTYSTVNLYSAGVRAGNEVKIYFGMDNEDGHSHDGINSQHLDIATESLQDDAVTYDKINYTYTSYSYNYQSGTPGPALWDMPASWYVHLPRAYKQNAGTTANFYFTSHYIGTSWYSIRCTIAFTDTYGYAYGRAYYVTASGNIVWVFMLREKTTGNIVHGRIMGEHPCLGTDLEPEEMPLPLTFMEILQEEPDRWDILLCTPSINDMKKVCLDAAKRNKFDIDVLLNGYDIIEDDPPFPEEEDVITKISNVAIDSKTKEEYPLDIPITRLYSDKKLIIPVKKKKIKKPDMIKMVSFKVNEEKMLSV